MSENVIIAIIGAVGTLIGGIIGTIGAVFIARMNRPPQEQKAPLPPSSGSSKIKVAFVTAIAGLVAGLLISFWMFSGKSSHSQENGAATPVANVSDPIPAQKEVASATPIPKAASDSTQNQASEPTEKPTLKQEPALLEEPAPTEEAAPTEEPAPTEEAAPKEKTEKPKSAPKEEKPKPAPKEGPGKKKK